MRLQTMIFSMFALGLLGLDGGAMGSALAAEAAVPRVVIQEFMFAPTTLTVKAGAVVTWLNKDEEPHTIFSDSGLFRSGAVDTDGTFEYKFDKPGTYHYLCTIHPRMVGTIIVE
jgi:plastocyanin